MKIANQHNLVQRKKRQSNNKLSSSACQITKHQTQNTNKFSLQNMSLIGFDGEHQSPTGSLENGQITQFYFQKLIHIEYQLCLVVFLNMFLIVIAASISFPQLTQHNTVTYKGCLYFAFVCFIIECFLLCFRMFTILQLQKQQKILYEKSTIFSSKKILYFFLQCLLMFVQPYPFIEGINIAAQNSYENTQFLLPVNDLLTVFSIARIYILIRAGLTLTPYRSTRSNRLCKMYGCKADFSFSLKCMFKDNPLMLIGVFFAISSMIFAFQIYIIERRAALLSAYTTGISNNYTNALWLVLITITTVGYGDYFPHTDYGRVIILIVAIWGIFIISMMVVVVSNTLTMQKNEKRTSIVINKLELRNEIEAQAQKFIGYFFLKKRYEKLLKQYDEKSKKLRTEPMQESQNSLSSSSAPTLQQMCSTSPQKQELIKKYRKYKHKCNKIQKNFSALRKQLKNGQDVEDIEDQVASHFLHVNSDIEILNKNQQKIINFIHQHLEYKGKNSKQEDKQRNNGQYNNSQEEDNEN